MVAIIFDVDDTLYDQLEPFQQALRQTIDVDEQLVEKIYLHSRKISDGVFHLTEAGEMSLLDMQVYRIQQTLKQFQYPISRQEAEQFQLRYQQFQSQIQLLPDVERTLNYCVEKNVPLGIITNGPAAHQWKKIWQLQATKWIPEEHVFISSDIGYAKPDKRLFAFAESRMNLVKSETYYIGDSFQNDIIGAKNAGWNTVWCNHRQRVQTTGLVSSDYVVDETHPLESVIRQII